MSDARKPSVLTAILVAIPTVIVIGVTVFLTAAVLTLIFLILAYIPIINALLEHLFDVRGDSPEVFALFASAMLSYYVARACVDRLSHHNPTTRLSLKISGSVVIAWYGFALVTNLIYHEEGLSYVPSNIVFIIEGIVLYCASSKYPDPPAAKTESTAAPDDESYYYLETESGMTVRVPESKLDDSAPAQTSKKPLTPEQRELIKQALKQRIYGDDSEGPRP